MTTTLTAALCACALALGLAACGSSSTSTGGGSQANAASPRTAFRCLEKAGVNVKSTPPNSAKIVSAFAIDNGKSSQILVWFMSDAKAANQYSKAAAAFLSKAAGGNATAEVVGKTIVVGRGPDTTDDQLGSVDDCLTA